MKKSISLLLAFSLSIVTLAGCAPNANQQTQELPSTVNTGNGENPESSAPSITGDSTLRVVLASGGRTLDPAAATDGISAIFVNAAYDQLVGFDVTEKNGFTIADPEKIIPSLAKSWEVSEDGLTYFFYLDENAKFANGDPVDADAVIYSLERVKNSNTSSFLFALTNITELEKVDDYTVIFNLSKPCTIMFKLLQMHILSIVNPRELDGIADVNAYLAKTTAGSGGYNIQKWEPSSEAILLARQDYWKGSLPVSTINIQFVAEAANRVMLADKGDADIVMTIPPKDIDILTGNEKLSVNVYDSNTIHYLPMNNQVAPFDQVSVRQAINYAIPYDSIINDILMGQAASLSYPVPAAMPAHLDHPTEQRTLDLEKAKALLADAGYSDGLEFRLTVSNTNQIGQDIAVLIQAELSKINVKVDINILEASQFSEAMKAGNIQAAITEYTAFVNDPGYLFGNTLNSQGEYNYANYASSQVDALWDAAEASNDLDFRYQSYIEAQQIVFADAPWAILYEGRTPVVLSESIANYIHYPDGSLRFYQVEKK